MSNAAPKPRAPRAGHRRWLTPALGISLASLVLAAGGATYAVAAGSGTISACVKHRGGGLYEAQSCAKHDSRLTWNVTGPQGPKGLQGPKGDNGQNGSQGIQGVPGPGGVILHVDTTQAFSTTTLGHLGPWTITATCTNDGTTAVTQVRAVGPANTVADGSEVTGTGGFVYSDGGSQAPIGDDLSATTATDFNAVNLDLYSPTAGGAHISLYKYEQGPNSGGGFRCKISGSGYTSS
jgi:hypothetical protein